MEKEVGVEMEEVEIEKEVEVAVEVEEVEMEKEVGQRWRRWR